MFARLMQWMQLRQSTSFLLSRYDDRLLDDIGLTRADLQAMQAPQPRRSCEKPQSATPCAQARTA